MGLSEASVREIESLAQDDRYSAEFVGNVVRSLLARGPDEQMSEAQQVSAHVYLEPGRSISPKSEAAIEEVLRAAADSLSNVRYWVRMTVSAYVEAKDKAEAMQAGCDLVNPLVVDGRLGVHTVDAYEATS